MLQTMLLVSSFYKTIIKNVSTNLTNRFLIVKVPVTEESAILSQTFFTSSFCPEGFVVPQ